MINRPERQRRNMQVIELIRSRYNQGRVPSYQQTIEMLNNQEQLTNAGNRWTRKSLFRMLQRQGISGLHGLLR